MSDLRQCPFCGGKAKELPARAFRVWVICDKCNAEGPPKATHNGAISAWNRREPDYEKRWGELVETVATRTDQAKAGK